MKTRQKNQTSLVTPASGANRTNPISLLRNSFMLDLIFFLFLLTPIGAPSPVLPTPASPYCQVQHLLCVFLLRSQRNLSCLLQINSRFVLTCSFQPPSPRSSGKLAQSGSSKQLSPVTPSSLNNNAAPIPPTKTVRSQTAYDALSASSSRMRSSDYLGRKQTACLMTVVSDV